MKRGKIIRAADLFCGAGGTTTGLLQACRALDLRLKLVAVNHWPRAIETHLANHPWATHICQSLTSFNPPPDGEKTVLDCIDAVDPARAVASMPGRGKRLDLLVASPECTDHSRAKGGRPRNAQLRATPWCILRWAEAVAPRRILIENVCEFTEWGPLGRNGKPIKSKRGRLFKAFLGGLEALNYRVEWRVLNAADYGDATTRRRFFLQAVRGRGKIVWPDPSHAPAGGAEELGREPWVAARDVIDWSIPSKSIFGRKKPLSSNTIRRIAAGIEKYWGAWAEPFLVVMNYLSRPGYDKRYTKDLDRPVPTITSQGNRLYVVEPLLLPQHGGADARGVRHPVSTVATKGAIRVVEPFVVPASNGAAPRSVNQPVNTITSEGRGNRLISPLVVRYDRTGKATPVDAPIGTLTTHARYGVAEPGLVVDEEGNRYALDIRFRMLQPPELAAAMSFPADYQFTGTKTERVKQIGNAVPVRTAEALCRAALSA